MSKPLVPITIETRAREIRQLLRAARNAASQAVVYAVLAGKELCAAKADLPHGEFMPWVERELQLNARTARNYMSLFSALRPKLLKNTAVNEVLALPPASLTEEQSAALQKAVHKITGADTLTDMYRNFGIIRHNDHNPGGAKEVSAEAPLSAAEQLERRRRQQTGDFARVWQLLDHLGTNFTCLSDSAIEFERDVLKAFVELRTQWLAKPRAQRDAHALEDAFARIRREADQAASAHAAVPAEVVG